MYSTEKQPCIRNNFNLNWLDDLWKLDERFSAEWAGAPCCLYNLCEKLVRMVHFYGAVLLVASLQKQFSPKPPSVLQTRAYAISLSLKVNWFITPGKCRDWKERSTAALWQWFGRHWLKTIHVTRGPREKSHVVSFISGQTDNWKKNKSLLLFTLNDPLLKHRSRLGGVRVSQLGEGGVTHSPMKNWDGLRPPGDPCSPFGSIRTGIFKLTMCVAAC